MVFIMEFSLLLRNSLEGIHFFSKISDFYQNYQDHQVVNVSRFGAFNVYNGNLGASYTIIKKGNNSLSFNAGGKLYYGPEFDFLHYYKNGDYNIYFDSAPY